MREIQKKEEKNVGKDNNYDMMKDMCPKGKLIGKMTAIWYRKR